jgi:large subunit ribosomal protein L10
MSKPVKDMIVAAYQKRFANVNDALVIDIRGIDANVNNDLRLGLQEKQIRVTVLRNALAKKAFAGTALQGLDPALEGPCALACGSESVVNVARELVDWAKKIKELSFKGAVLDGQYFEGEKGVKRLSEFPTKQEAQAKVVQLILSPARNVMGVVKSPGAKLLGIVKQVQEKLEKGEAIAKVG